MSQKKLQMINWMRGVSSIFALNIVNKNEKKILKISTTVKNRVSTCCLPLYCPL